MTSMAGKHRLKKTRNQRRTLGATWAAGVALVAIMLMGFATPTSTGQAPEPVVTEQIVQTQMAAMQAWKQKVDAIPTFGSKSPTDEADSARTARQGAEESTCR